MHKNVLIIAALTACYCCLTSITKANNNIVQISGSFSMMQYISYLLQELTLDNRKFDVFTFEGSGTSLALSNFCNGNVNLIAASRPISEKEIKVCKKNKITSFRLFLGNENIIPVVSKHNNLKYSNLNEKQLYDAIFSRIPKQSVLWSYFGIRAPLSKNIPVAIYIPSHKHGTRSIIDDYLGKNMCSAENGNLCLRVRNDGTIIEVDGGISDIVQSIIFNRDALGIIGCVAYNVNSSRLEPIYHEIFGDRKKSVGSCESIGWKMKRPFYIYVNLDYYKRNPIVQKMLLTLMSPYIIGVNGALFPGIQPPTNEYISSAQELLKKYKSTPNQ